MKRIIALIAHFAIAALFFAPIFASVFPVALPVSTQACTPSPSVGSATQSNFCTVFPESVASCWPPVGTHKNFTPEEMKANYVLIVTTYGSLKAACRETASKNGSSAQACYDQWTCYMDGGQDPDGKGLCSGTGDACV